MAKKSFSVERSGELVDTRGVSSQSWGDLRRAVQAWVSLIELYGGNEVAVFKEHRTGQKRGRAGATRSVQERNLQMILLKPQHKEIKNRREMAEFH